MLWRIILLQCYNHTRNMYCTFVARPVLLSFAPFIEVAAFLEDTQAAGFEVHELSHSKGLLMATGKLSTCIDL